MRKMFERRERQKRRDYWGGGFKPFSVVIILFDVFISLRIQFYIYIKSTKLSNQAARKIEKIGDGSIFSQKSTGRSEEAAKK